MSPLTWLDERLGFSEGWRSFSQQTVPGGARARHVFPAVLLYLLILQGVLGTVLATYYSPSVTDAWASTAYLSDRVTMGWFIRGLHYHGASALVIVVGLYLAVIGFTRAYRKPREIMWWCVIGLVGLALALGVTGNPLPWDEQGYWGIQVEFGIMEQSPGGQYIRAMAQGGSDAGNFTLLRLYVLHMFILPGGFAALIGVIIHQIRKHGAPPPDKLSEQEAQRLAKPYFPNQMFLDVVAMTLVTGALIGMTVATHGAELWAPADPTSGYQARPEWYFMALYKLRMAFEGPLEPIATMVLPGLAGGFLVAAPFIDSMMGKAGRLIVVAGVGVLIAGVVAMTVVALKADADDEDYQKAVAVAEKEAKRARALAKDGVVPLGGTAVYFNDPQYQDKALFKEHCGNCHAIDGIGGQEAPDLTDYSSRAWMTALIRNPKDIRFFGATDYGKGDDGMDAYPEDSVSTEQMTATVEYLMSLQGETDVDAALVKKGKELWDDELECNACHEVEAGVEADGPNMFGHGSKDWVMRVIRDSSKADLFGERAQMPKFEGKLKDDEIERLAEFVVGQRAPTPETDADAG